MAPLPFYSRDFGPSVQLGIEGMVSRGVEIAVENLTEAL
jgi:hypothetical protein